jgi:aminomethyltransferase
MVGKRTPLYDWHVAHGANMALFAGYNMPLWYPAGMREEHLRVLTGAGMFDTSHMSVLRLAGPDIYQLLQWCFSRDLEHCIGKKGKPLVPGRCTYGVFLSEAGGVVDDVIIFQISESEYLAVVNAGMGASTKHHILNYIDTCDGSCNVIVNDLTDKVGKIDIQGPKVAHIMRDMLVDFESVAARMPYFSFKGSFWDGPSETGTVKLKTGDEILLSRTGYTGEFGFEIFARPERLTAIWEALLDAGKPYNILPCGLAARDSLRGGAVLPLTHQDNGNWRYINNPWSIALPFTADKNGFTKDFLGRKSLEGAPPSTYTYPFVGNDVRKVVFGDTPPIVIDSDGKVIGIVLTCVTDVGIGWHNGRIYSVTSPDKPAGFAPKGLACGFIKVTVPLVVGSRVMLRDRHREIEVMVAEDIRPDRTARYSVEHIMVL